MLFTLTNRVSVEIHPIEGSYSTAQKKDFMRRATEVVVEIIGCSAEEVVVSFVENRAENVSRAGVPFSQRG